MSKPKLLLAAQGIAKSYGPVTALRSVDLAVHSGEIHALLGANGAGKSTLVKILAGVQPADQGVLRVEGRSVRFRTPADALHAGIATVFQDPALIPDLTVAQNLRLSRIDMARFRAELARFALEQLDLAALVRELPLETLQKFDNRIETDVFGPLSLQGSLNARNTLGGTAPAQVRLQIARHRARLG